MQIFRRLLNIPSRPVWARGLKPKGEENMYHCVMSRPVWARGLKRARRMV